MFVSKNFGNKGRVPYFQQARFESQGIKPSAPRAQVAHDQAEWAAKFWRAAGFRPARAAGVVDGLLSPEPAPEGLAPGLAFSNRDQGFRYSKTSEQSLLLTELTFLFARTQVGPRASRRRLRHGGGGGGRRGVGGGRARGTILGHGVPAVLRHAAVCEAVAVINRIDPLHNWLVFLSPTTSCFTRGAATSRGARHERRRTSTLQPPPS